MTHRYHHDDFNDPEEDTLRLLGSRFAGVAADADRHHRPRRRQDREKADGHAPNRKQKRVRQRVN